MNSYSKTNWQDSPSTDTPLSAENLNKIEAGIEAATNGVIALDTNKITEMTDNDGDGDYPTSNAVKNYLESNYYNADEAETVFQPKLYAGENITIGSVQGKAVISADLTAKYDSSNIEEGNATLTAYTGQSADSIKSASCIYQRIGGFVTVNVAVVFNAVTLNANKSIHLINLPYQNASTPVHFTGISSKNAVFKGSVPKSSTWLSMMYATPKDYTFTDGEQLNFALIYKI